MAVTKSTRLLVVWMAASVCVVAALRPSHHHRPSSHHTALEPTDADAVPVPAPIVSVVETDTEIDAGTGTDTDANVAMSDIDYQKWFNSWKWGTSDVESLHKLYYHPYTQVTGALQTIQYPKCNNHHRGFCVSGLNTDQSTDARNGRMRYIKFRASYSGEKSPGGAYVMPVMTALYGNDKKFTGSLGSATPHKVVSGHIINSKLGAQHPSVNENPINFFVQTAASNTRSTWSDAEDIMKVAAEGCMNKNQPINNCDVIVRAAITPSLPHSLTPSLPHSLTPSLHHSITPSPSTDASTVDRRPSSVILTLTHAFVGCMIPVSIRRVKFTLRMPTITTTNGISWRLQHLPFLHPRVMQRTMRTYLLVVHIPSNYHWMHGKVCYRNWPKKQRKRLNRRRRTKRSRTTTRRRRRMKTIRVMIWRTKNAGFF